jgi:hypothetical protein
MTSDRISSTIIYERWRKKHYRIVLQKANHSKAHHIIVLQKAHHSKAHHIIVLQKAHHSSLVILFSHLRKATVFAYHNRGWWFQLTCG